MRIVAGPTGVEIMAEAVKAAKAVFTRHGMERASVVVNVAWRENDIDCAMGSKVPSARRKIMAASLSESAEEAADA